MIAPAIDPARQADCLSDLGLAKLAAIMGAIGVHGIRSKPWEALGFGGLWGAGQGRLGWGVLAGFSRHKCRLT
jgi:hypothetical protein